jgi:acylphosphatase
VSEATTRIARRFVVAGRVQGVCFRAFTQARATELGVAGWVRNLQDGRVECVAAGSPGDLARLRSELEQGPPAARVVEVEEEPFAGPVDPGAFAIRR